MKKFFLRLLLGYAVVMLLWGSWYFGFRSLESEFHATQANFWRAVEDRDWASISFVISPNYQDAAGYTRETGVGEARQALGNFLTLMVKDELLSEKVTRHPDDPKHRAVAVATIKLRLDGNGMGASSLVVSKVNSISAPWIVQWEKTGPWPWDWHITEIHNDELFGVTEGSGLTQ
jgi:hypothetical protein